MLNPQYIVHQLADRPALIQAAADYWLAQAQLAIGQRGVFHVALTGGSTPQPLYRKLATPAMATQLDWSCVHIFIGDERYVPYDHPDSNFGMAKHCLLDHVPVPQANLHPVPTHFLQASEAAADYAKLLQALVSSSGGQLPILDLVMLGMGDDGHTASLFPDTEILLENQQTVAAVYVDKLAAWRVSMTYPLLNQARQTMVMVSGESKAGILAHVLQADSERIYPIQSVLPVGEMHWFIDQAAAGKLA